MNFWSSFVPPMRSALLLKNEPYGLISVILLSVSFSFLADSCILVAAFSALLVGSSVRDTSVLI